MVTGLREPGLETLKEGIKWLYPGLGFKRWLLVTLVGLLVALFGGLLLTEHWAPQWISGATSATFREAISFPFYAGPVVLTTGIVMVTWGMYRAGRAVADIILPHQGRQLVENLYYRRYLEKGPKIVALGGGTGLSVLLRGMKEYTSNITAVVTMTDDGGSSGRLRNEMGMLPPGDLRNCLLALADTEPLLEQLFQHRFRESKSLEGHSFGNLFLAAMTEMMGFEQAIREFSKVLAVRGKVLPVTLDPITLNARFVDGMVSTGQTQIVDRHKTIERISLSPENCRPMPDVLEAIGEASAIVLGPGSLYTSVLPNLMVPGVKEAIRDSSALCFYICNMMTQPGETGEMNASAHLEALYRHGCEDLVDVVIVNTDTTIPEHLAEKYRLEGAVPVAVDNENLSRWNLEILQAHLLAGGDLAHHNGRKLAVLILEKVVEREAGLEGLWAYTFMSLNSEYRRARKEMGSLVYHPLSSTQKRLRRFLAHAFKNRNETGGG